MDRLKLLRKELKKTQTDIANVLGITVSAYGNYELGQREPDNANLVKLARYFNVSTDYLLGLSDERSPKQSIQQSSNLTSRESQLLSVFNSLSPSEQGEVLGFAKGLANKSQSDVG